jgi:DNA-directed RNA polymerase specialized sigma24 family protein
MAESRALAARFTEHRRQLLRVAYRLLGSLREANDVVDRALLSLTQDDAREVDLTAESLIATVARS